MVTKLQGFIRLLVAVKIFSCARGEEALVTSRNVKSPLSEASYRGESFGLENFLMQTFDDENFNGDINLEVEKEVPKKTIRGQTWGLESMTRDLGYSEFPAHNQEPDHRVPQHRHPGKTEQPLSIRFETEKFDRKSDGSKRLYFPEREKERHRPKKQGNTNDNDSGQREVDFERNESIRKPLQRPITFHKKNSEEIKYGSDNGQEVTTGRPKKRIAMRRRKRPTTTETFSTENLETPSTLMEMQTDSSIFEKSKFTLNPNDSVLLSSSSTTNKPINTEFNQELQQEQRSKQFQQKRKRPMGFRVPAAARRENEHENIPIDENGKTSEVIKNESDSCVDCKKNDETQPTLPTKLNDPPAEENAGDSSEIKSFNRLKLFLRKHQNGTGVSLSELLQTRNLSLTDLLTGTKQDVIVDPDSSTTLPTVNLKDQREDFKSRQDNFSKPSRSNSVPSVATRPFSRNEKPLRHGYIKKKYNNNQDDRNLAPVTEDYKNNHDENNEKNIHANKTERTNFNRFPYKNRIRKTYKNTEGVEEEEEDEEKNVASSDTKPSREKSPETNKQQGSRNQESSHPFATDSRDSTTENVGKLSTTSLHSYRRKLKVPNGSYHNRDSELATKFEPSNVVEQQPTSIVPTISSVEKETNNKGYLRRNIKNPFKSTNNPELALIFPNQKSKHYLNDRGIGGGIKIPSLNNAKKEGSNDDSAKNGEDRVQIAKNEIKPEQRVINFNISEGEEVVNKHGGHQTAVVESTLEVAESNKDEILELLKSASTAQKLEKILASRNMTIGELLLNREKGSAQTNVSRLFLSPSETDSDSIVRSTTTMTTTEGVFEDSKKKKRKSQQTKEIIVPTRTFSHGGSIRTFLQHQMESDDDDDDESFPITIDTDEINLVKNATIETRKKGDRNYRVGDLQLNQQENNNANDFPHKQKRLESLFEKREQTIDYNLYSSVAESSDPITAIIKQAKPQAIIDNYHIGEEPQFFPSNDIAAQNNNFLKNGKINREEKSGNEFPSEDFGSPAAPLAETKKQRNLAAGEADKTFIPPVIKSTIIISGVVIGIALLVFIAIFAACGWKQRQLRLKANSCILNETLACKSNSKKKLKSSKALSPIEIKRSNTYKKTCDFDDSRSVISVSSEASSYLWNTLKNTFTSRNSTLKNRLEKENSTIREGIAATNKKRQANNQSRMNLAAADANKYDERLMNSCRSENEKYCSTYKKNCSDKDVMRTTTDSFRRGIIINNNNNSSTCSGNNSNGKNYRFDTWTQN